MTSMEYHKECLPFALSLATADRTSSTMQRDTTQQPTALRIGGKGLTKPSFERGRAILVKNLDP